MSFLTDDEKRAAIGYGPAPVKAPTATADFATAAAEEERFNHNHDELGRFTTSDGAVNGGAAGASSLIGASSVAEGRPRDRYADAEGSAAARDTIADASSELEDAKSRYRPDQLGWHDFGSENVVCRKGLRCTENEMRDWLSRYTVPGQDPDRPFVNGEMSLVQHPTTGFPAGWVRTYRSNDGLSATNITTMAHFFYDGIATRSAKKNEDGSWSIVTRGIGNNVWPMNYINQFLGPSIFEKMDMKMRTSIERSRRENKNSLAGPCDTFGRFGARGLDASGLGE